MEWKRCEATLPCGQGMQIPRGADLESAVSQDCILHDVSEVERVGTCRRSADCPSSFHFDATSPKPEAKAGKSAIQQIPNRRYEAGSSALSKYCAAPPARNCGPCRNRFFPTIFRAGPPATAPGQGGRGNRAGRALPGRSTPPANPRASSRARSDAGWRSRRAGGLPARSPSGA